MPAKLTVLCDACGTDLSVTTNCEDWRLCLRNEAIPSCGGVVTAMGVEPILAANCYFCSWRCLVAYVKDRELKNQEAQREFESKLIRL